MCPLRFGCRGIGISWHKGSAARFLFHQNTEVELQHVHTSLQAQHGGEEGRFYHHLCGIETPYLCGEVLFDGFSDILQLILCINMELGCGWGGEETHGILLKKLPGRGCIGALSVLCVKGFIEELSCQIS